MMVMPSNNSKAEVHYLSGRYPGAVGHLYSPGGQRGPYAWLPYALDNGVFGAYTRGQPWEAAPFIDLLRWATGAAQRPLWAVVPDAVGDAAKTLELWAEWAPRVRAYGVDLAFAAQDGHTPADVPEAADVVFIGGTTDWKRASIKTFCKAHKRVHVGRINTLKWLRYCRDAGAESCDGTGWFRGDQRQIRGLRTYLAECAGGPEQLTLVSDLPGARTVLD